MRLSLQQQLHEERIEQAYRELIGAPDPIAALHAFGRMKGLINSRDPEVTTAMEGERMERAAR